MFKLTVTVATAQVKMAADTADCTADSRPLSDGSDIARLGDDDKCSITLTQQLEQMMSPTPQTSRCSNSDSECGDIASLGSDGPLHEECSATVAASGQGDTGAACSGRNGAKNMVAR